MVGFLPILLDTAADTAEIGPPEVGYPPEEYLTVRLEMD